MFQDIESFDLEDFQHNYVNMTAFRIVDAEDSSVQRVLKDMEKYSSFSHFIIDKSQMIKVSKE